MIPILTDLDRAQTIIAQLREHDPVKAAMLLLLAARMQFAESATFLTSARMIDDTVRRHAFGDDERKPS